MREEGGREGRVIGELLLPSLIVCPVLTLPPTPLSKRLKYTHIHRGRGKRVCKRKGRKREKGMEEVVIIDPDCYKFNLQREEWVRGGGWG